MDVSHPVSRNFKTYFPDIPSRKVTNPASRKRPAGPHPSIQSKCAKEFLSNLLQSVDTKVAETINQYVNLSLQESYITYKGKVFKTLI